MYEIIQFNFLRHLIHLLFILFTWFVEKAHNEARLMFKKSLPVQKSDKHYSKNFRTTITSGFDKPANIFFKCLSVTQL